MCSTYKLVKIHEEPCYMPECVRILNDEWPRSLIHRTRSLAQSSDDLPMSLVFVQISEENEKVLGHVRLRKVAGDTGLYIESLVIDKSERGKGYGKNILERAEELIKQLGYNLSLLKTRDKQSFYMKFGYCPCPPIQLYGSFTKQKLESQNELKVSNDNIHQGCNPLVNNKPSQTNNLIPLPPPLPISLSNQIKTGLKISGDSFQKILS